MATQKPGVPHKSAHVLKQMERWPHPKFVAARHKSIVEGNCRIPTLASGPADLGKTQTPLRSVVREGKVRERPETGPFSIESSMRRSPDRRRPGDLPIEQ